MTNLRSIRPIYEDEPVAESYRHLQELQKEFFWLYELRPKVGRLRPGVR